MSDKNYVDFTHNFKRLIDNDNSEKFTIIINIIESDQQSYFEVNITLTKARILSSKINDLYQIDPTIDFYEIKMENIYEKKDIEEVFDLLKKAIDQKVEIDPEKRQLFNELLILLGEDDKIEFSISTIQEAISFLNTEFQSHSIQFLSTHLFQFVESEYINEINEEIKYSIFDQYILTQRGSPNFSEEAVKIFEQLKSMSELKILMHFLTELELNEMNEDMLNFFYDNIDDEIIENEFPRIINLIKNHISLLIKYSHKSNVIDCQYKNNKFDGIINYLVKTEGKDLVKNGILTLTNGTLKTGINYPITNLIEYDSDKIFINHEGSIPKKETAWVEFDFGERKINVDSYSIRSPNGKPNVHIPKTWQIIGSNDQKEWDVLDRVENSSLLNHKLADYRFVCKNNNNKYYRYIRYFQEDGWHYSNKYPYHFNISCIEFFGSILFNSS